MRDFPLFVCISKPKQPISDLLAGTNDIAMLNPLVGLALHEAERDLVISASVRLARYVIASLPLSQMK